MAFLGVVLLLAVMYYNGAFSREREGRASVWSWKSLTEAPRGRVDWEKRREHVARAFEQSWDAYERYAWGKCRPFLVSSHFGVSPRSFLPEEDRVYRLTDGQLRRRLR